MLLATTLLFQIAYTSVFGILTQTPNASTPIRFEDDEPAPARPARKINGTPPRSSNWKTILRDATFQSLIKHTDFTPSLEEKMESDRLLWEKIQKAKFLRKNTAKAEETEQTKMGVLLDMTKDGGSLEFRQSDRSVYTCPDNRCDEVLKRLLAVWKIEKFEPNDVWIRVKVPRQGQEEDIYEYTAKHGLQQMNGRFSPNSTKHKVTTASPIKDDPTYTIDQDDRVSSMKAPGIDERYAEVDRMDLITLAPPNTKSNVLKPNIVRNFKDFQQVTNYHDDLDVGEKDVVTVSATPKGRSGKIERQTNVRVGRTHQKAIKAPKNSHRTGTSVALTQVYDLDDLERAESATVTEPMLNEGVTEANRRLDFGLTTPRKIIYEVKNLKLKNLPGSQGKDFFKYDSYMIPKRPQLPLRFPNEGSATRNTYYQVAPFEPDFRLAQNVLKEFRGNSQYEGFLPSLGPTGSPFTTTVSYTLPLADHFSPGFTEYETVIHHKPTKPKNFKPSLPLPQYSELDPIYHGDGVGSVFTNAETKTLLALHDKLQAGLNQKKNATGTEYGMNKTQNYTSVVISEKLPSDTTEESSIHVSRFTDTKGNNIVVTSKPPTRKELLVTKVKSGLKSILKPSSAEVADYAPLYVKWGEKLKTTPKPPTSSTTEDAQTTEISESTTTAKNEDQSTLKTNMVIDNMGAKTPEEIVNMLTNIGMVNTTRIEGYPPVSEKTLETSSKILEKITKDHKPSHSDPISLIVNRISQSYSYRTSKGKVKNFKRMRRLR